MQLSRLFQIPFLSPRVSLPELLGFATETKERLAASTQGGAFAGLVAGISGAIAGLNAATVADLTKLGRRKGAKGTKAGFRRALPRKLSRVGAGLIAHYGADAPELLLVFPQGRQAVVRTTDDQMGGALSTIVAALTPLAPAMGGYGNGGAGHSRSAGGRLGRALRRE